MVLLKLVWSNLVARKTRFALTAAAVALSVSLVISVTSGYATMEAAAMRFLGTAMGATDATITRSGPDRTAGFDASIVAAIAADSSVKSAIGRLDREALLSVPDHDDRHGAAQVIGITRPGDSQVDQLAVQRGQWFTGNAGDVAVIDQVLSDRLKLAVGDTLTLPSPHKPLPVKIVAVVQKPGILAAMQQTVYLPLATAQRWAAAGEGDSARPILTRVSIDLKPNVSSQSFADIWQPKLAAIDPALKLSLTSDNRREVDKNLQGVRLMSRLGGMASMLAATFIVFSALSMGVAERQRTLAMLRAIGASRAQVAGLVLIEGVSFASAGAAIGVPLGILCVKILISLPAFHAFFKNIGVVVEGAGLAIALGGSIGSSLVASLLPAWRATRVEPLEAMVPLAATPTTRAPLLAASIGVVLIAIDVLLFFGPVRAIVSAVHPDNAADIARSATFYGHFAIGLPGLMLGFFLLAPLFVWTIERMLGPIVAAVLGVRFALLRQQLSAGIWRAAGTCAALMVGLAILVALQVQGTSMLHGWVLPDKFPDVFIFSAGAMLGPADIARVEAMPGIVHDDVLPVAVASPQFGTSIFSIIGGAVAMPDATMFLGIDPVKALRMMQLEFRDAKGQPLFGQDRARAEAAAIAGLRRGRHLIITDELRQLKGYTVGSVIPLKTVNGMVDYTVAGVVWSPGVDVIVSRFDLGRQFDQRTASSVFGSLDDAKHDFGANGVYLLAANLDYFTNRDDVLKRLKAELRTENLMIGDIRQVKKSFQDGLTVLLNLVSTVAFAAMAVASLGVANTVMASVRTRRWQFGILRSIGVTRGQLLRLVLAEAVLIGLAGCALGLAAGAVMSLDGRQLLVLTTGYNPPISVPWAIIGGGVLLVMLITLLASLWPAASVAREQPLALLQAGRAAA